jgi:hypothetical protein
MKETYQVFKLVSYDQVQTVEANSMEEAMELADALNEWDDPQETNYELHAHKVEG